jgi:hypothetical protein
LHSICNRHRKLRISFGNGLCVIMKEIVEILQGIPAPKPILLLHIPFIFRGAMNKFSLVH